MTPRDDRTNACAVSGAVAFAPHAVVAIPVRNESERIVACLDALDAQDGSGLGVVLFLNNCTDDTARVVAARQPSLRTPMRVIERTFSHANAGWARREAMEAAAAWLEEGAETDGWILTTDADSRVPHDWVARNCAALARGVDAVAGQIRLDAADAARLPRALHARGRLEGAYEALLTELEAWIDPLPHDPWPRHATTSGATLAVRLSAYRQVGGMPPLAVGEDRAFVSSLLSSDARVRHDPEVIVITSGRLEGRAPGGAADTMKLRCEEPESPCDKRLEPLTRALFRFVVRRHLRCLYARGRLGRTVLWPHWLRIPRSEARAIAGRPTFGAVLAEVERLSPRLSPQPLRPSELPARIVLARWLLRALHAAAVPSRGLSRLRVLCRTFGRVAERNPVPGPDMLGRQPRLVLSDRAVDDVAQAAT